MPLRLLEIGASAGLNLRWDQYWYQAGPSEWGNPRSTIRFENAFSEGGPPFDVTARIVELMNACDVVVTLPGATTCAEARVVGRRLVLLDAMPGHGRENLQHELELGDADVASARPA